jgi:hypothetical protein
MGDETPVVPVQPVVPVEPMPDHMDMVPPPAPAKPANPVQEFLKEYEVICDKYGLVFVANPVWLDTNHNSFELSIKISVVQKAKKQ